MGRTQDDQILRGGQRGVDFLPQVGGRSKLLLVAEDRRQALWNNTVIGEPPDKRSWYAELLDFLVQPVGQLFVFVAVAEEGEIARLPAANAPDLRRAGFARP